MRIETILLLAGGVAAAWWVFGKGVLPDLMGPVGPVVQLPAISTATPPPAQPPGVRAVVQPQPAPVTTPGVSFFPGMPNMPNTPPTVH